ncbi:CapA family protein [Mycobacterium botniense]|uniref:Putative polyglutamine synthesis accessory protein n=1 Tax=Mycobacterium botniense TaxID=84962 RepID=A0A7I9Y1E2_9MYCO|nr:CapA family protein [Mycobacterium botniense]GFG75830.1 putative polyglutamine synthesis accessory protein [Mycobacterium botniense]
MRAAETTHTVFLCGDVMTGRGLDQILPHRGSPELHEPVVTDARTYVALAEQTNGPIAVPVDFAWPWGEAAALLDEVAPDVRLINLETSITADGEFAPGKTVHYRMHPDNIACLTVIRPDAVALANNHVMDFGIRGLADTLRALDEAGLRGVGAGLTVEEAECPAVVGLPHGRRVVIAARGTESSGIPHSWAAGINRPGVALLADLSDQAADEITGRVMALKQPGDIAIVSVHWGSNWGYGVEPAQRRFAHRLIDAGIDVVHGHSSHHPRPVEIYRGKLIVYGCGDLIDDYEGIRTHGSFRPELRLLYFARTDGDAAALLMVPMRARRMRLERATRDEAEWLRSTLEQVSRPFGTRVRLTSDGALTVSA